VDDHLGAFERLEAGGAIAQVEVGGANRPDLGTELVEQGDRGTAEEAPAASDGYRLAGPEVGVRGRGGHKPKG